MQCGSGVLLAKLFFVFAKVVRVSTVILRDARACVAGSAGCGIVHWI